MYLLELVDLAVLLDVLLLQQLQLHLQKLYLVLQASDVLVFQRLRLGFVLELVHFGCESGGEGSIIKAFHFLVGGGGHLPDIE